MIAGLVMAVPFLLVDGYNLLYEVGLGRATYGPGEYESCRRRLLAELASRLSRAERERTIVVFDAIHSPSKLETRLQFDGISVLFPSGRDADSQIESMIAAHSAPKQVRVVSSDHRLQRAARQRGCQFVDSDAFWSQASPREAEAVISEAERVKYSPDGISAGEAKIWMREMGIDAEVEAQVESRDGNSVNPTASDDREEWLARGEEALREGSELLDGLEADPDNPGGER